MQQILSPEEHGLGLGTVGVVLGSVPQAEGLVAGSQARTPIPDGCCPPLLLLALQLKKGQAPWKPLIPF